MIIKLSQLQSEQPLIQRDITTDPWKKKSVQCKLNFEMESLGLLALFLVVGVCYGINTYDLPSDGLLSLVQPDMDEDWVIFKKSFNRSYANIDEELRRRLYWEDTINFIEDHNYRYDQGEFTYTLGENQFADMAEDEFEHTFMNGVILPEVPEEYPEPLTEPHPDDPLSLDWRHKGLVSDVKNQGQCGSCWAFSALGALEGQFMKHKGHMLDLSEQNLVDCCRGKWQNWGCRGGWMNNAYSYIKANNGIDMESCYPYEAKDGSCRYNKHCAGTNDKGSGNVAKGEHSLTHSLATVGPVAVAMDFDNKRLWYYKSGVFYSPYCNKQRPTHALVAVGYGMVDGKDSWIIKNSWSKNWGEQGYLFLARNAGDTCGVSEWASYPIL